MAKKLAMLFVSTLLLLLLAACAKGEILKKDGVVYNITRVAAYVAGYLPDADTVVWYDQVDGLPVKLDDSHWDDQWENTSPAATVIVAEGVKELPAEAFSYWENLQDVTLPDSLEVIGGGAFCGAGKLKEIILPTRVRKVGQDAFYYCLALERISIPASLTDWDDTAFMNCDKLSEIQVDAQNPLYSSVDGVLYNKDATVLYWYPEGKGSVYSIPEGTLEIDVDAFLYNNTIKSLTIPEGVTKIANDTFSTCPMLETVFLPSSITDVEDVFMGYGPRAVNVAPGNAVYYSIDGSLFRQADNTLLYHGHNDEVFYAVPEGTLAIGEWAFAEDDTLQAVSIPLGVTNIGSAAFGDCTALTSVALPITLRQIDDYAFGSCISLGGVALPPALHSIGNYAFDNCTSLRSIFIPDSVTYIGQGAFKDGDPRLVIAAGSGTVGEAYIQEFNAKDILKDVKIGVVNNIGSKELLDVRATPSADAASFTKCFNGTTVVILGEKNGWLNVQLGEATGYMPAESVLRWEGFTDLYTPVWGIVKGEPGATVNSFTQPMEGMESWRTFESGQVVKILQTIGPYYLIEVEYGVPEYIPAQFVSAGRLNDGNTQSSGMQRFGVVCNPSQRDRLHLRAEPSKASKSLARFFNGTQVEILSEEGEWYKVRVAGLEGYMMKQYVDGIL